MADVVFQAWLRKSAGYVKISGLNKRPVQRRRRYFLPLYQHG